MHLALVLALAMGSSPERPPAVLAVVLEPLATTVPSIDTLEAWVYISTRLSGCPNVYLDPVVSDSPGRRPLTIVRFHVTDSLGHAIPIDSGVIGNESRYLLPVDLFAVNCRRRLGVRVSPNISAPLPPGVYTVTVSVETKLASFIKVHPSFLADLSRLVAIDAGKLAPDFIDAVVVAPSFQILVLR